MSAAWEKGIYLEKKMKIGHYLLGMIIGSILCGCATNPWKEFYNDEGLVVTKDPHIQVRIEETSNLRDRVAYYLSQGYVVIGSSHFESEWVPRSKALKVAQQNGATLVVVGHQPTGTRQHNYTLAIPQTHTIYHQGQINSYTNTNSHTDVYARGNIYGSRSGSAWFNANANVNTNTDTYTNTSYQGTSTYQTMQFVNGSYQTAIFEQLAVFMVPKEKIEQGEEIYE